MKKQRLENILKGFLIVISNSEKNKKDDIINNCCDVIDKIYNDDVITLEILSQKLGYRDSKHLLQDSDNFDLITLRSINMLCEMNNIDRIFKNGVL